MIYLICLNRCLTEPLPVPPYVEAVHVIPPGVVCPCYGVRVVVDLVNQVGVHYCCPCVTRTLLCFTGAFAAPAL